MDLARDTLHNQIREIIRGKIRSGDYTDKLPSEVILMKEFSVSRATIREAITGLVQEGLLIRKQGLGTFVSENPVHEWLGYLYGFSEMMQQVGLSPAAKIIRSLWVHDEEVSSVLGVSDIYVIERLRSANQVPVAIEIAYFPFEIGKHFQDRAEEAFYPIIENELGILLDHAEQSISSIVATANEAKLLGVKIGHPMLLINRVTYDEKNRPVEVLRSIYRGDRYKFNVDLKRNRYKS